MIIIPIIIANTPSFSTQNRLWIIRPIDPIGPICPIPPSCLSYLIFRGIINKLCRVGAPHLLNCKWGEESPNISPPMRRKE